MLSTRNKNCSNRKIIAARQTTQSTATWRQRRQKKNLLTRHRTIDRIYVFKMQQSESPTVHVKQPRTQSTVRWCWVHKNVKPQKPDRSFLLCLRSCWAARWCQKKRAYNSKESEKHEKITRGDILSLLDLTRKVERRSCSCCASNSIRRARCTLGATCQYFIAFSLQTPPTTILCRICNL